MAVWGQRKGILRLITRASLSCSWLAEPSDKSRPRHLNHVKTGRRQVFFSQRLTDQLFSLKSPFHLMIAIKVDWTLNCDTNYRQKEKANQDGFFLIIIKLEEKKDFLSLHWVLNLTTLVNSVLNVLWCCFCVRRELLTFDSKWWTTNMKGIALCDRGRSSQYTKQKLAGLWLLTFV